MRGELPPLPMTRGETGHCHCRGMTTAWCSRLTAARSIWPSLSRSPVAMLARSAPVPVATASDRFWKLAGAVPVRQGLPQRGPPVAWLTGEAQRPLPSRTPDRPGTGRGRPRSDRGWAPGCWSTEHRSRRSTKQARAHAKRILLSSTANRVASQNDAHHCPPRLGRARSPAAPPLPPVSKTCGQKARWARRASGATAPVDDQGRDAKAAQDEATSHGCQAAKTGSSIAGWVRGSWPAGAGRQEQTGGQLACGASRALRELDIG